MSWNKRQWQTFRDELLNSMIARVVIRVQISEKMNLID